MHTHTQRQAVGFGVNCVQNLGKLKNSIGNVLIQDACPCYLPLVHATQPSHLDTFSHASHGQWKKHLHCKTAQERVFSCEIWITPRSSVSRMDDEAFVTFRLQVFVYSPNRQKD